MILYHVEVHGKPETGRYEGYCAGRFKLLEKNNVWILGTLVGIVTFICIFGVHVLNVTYTDWLLGGGDLTQNYLGWCFFRNSDWFFPFGLMDNASYPNTVSVIFTDSVPLFAVFLKYSRRFCRIDSSILVSGPCFVWAPRALLGRF